jgi:hypothetical protein
MEIEPIVKTVLLRCLTTELLLLPLLGHTSTTTTAATGISSSSSISIEILTFPANQQFRALAYVSELGGILIEQGNLTVVDVPAKSPVSCVITRFTQNDLAIWECVVDETEPVHWSARERDSEMARLRADIAVLQMENSLIKSESSHYNQQCARFLCALNELKADRERLSNELDALLLLRNSSSSTTATTTTTQQQQSGELQLLFGWSEWETLRVELETKDKCISQLKKQLRESDDQIQRLQQGELVSNDQGLWFCVDDDVGNGIVSGLSAKISCLEQRLVADFEGGIVFDEERGKNVETDGKTWTMVKWQARELDVYRNAYGSISSRDSCDELDFFNVVVVVPGGGGVAVANE